MYERELSKKLRDRIEEPRRFIQIVIGPRQTGKTTAVRQAMEKAGQPIHFISADDPKLLTGEWIRHGWEVGRELAHKAAAEDPSAGALLVIDEVQKVEQWSSYIKMFWDEDARTDTNLKVVLTGSSSMMLKRGMAESLMGRFEVLHSTHWSYKECKEAFDYSLDEYLYYGGYPGSSNFRGDVDRWISYMTESIVEPTIATDILQVEQVRKPALMRALFLLGAAYSGQELSYAKILGQLQDAGNTVTLAGYLDLLSNAGMLCGLEKFSEALVRRKKSSPRFMVYDPSLMIYASEARPEKMNTDLAWRGHLVESAVGAYLLARSRQERFTVHYWRDRGIEVDFVLRRGNQLTAIEVKSGRVKGTGGAYEFMKRNPTARSIIVGSSDVSLADFLLGKIDLFSTVGGDS